MQPRVALGLLAPLVGRGVFGLGFDNGDRLHYALHADLQQVVGALAAADIVGTEPQERPGRLFAVDPVASFRPAALMQGRVNQFGAGVGFVERRFGHGDRIACDLGGRCAWLAAAGADRA